MEQSSNRKESDDISDTLSTGSSNEEASTQSKDEIMYSEEELKKGEEFKEKGNQLVKGKFAFNNITDGKFEQALEMYSEAIYCKVPPKKKAVYYCNRAFVNLKCENYAIALFGKHLLN